MKPIPLFLKVKTSTQSPQFEIASDSTINFMGNTHEFASVLNDEIPKTVLDSLNRHSATVALVGPSESGKTTSLHEILRFFVQTDDSVQVKACEVNRNKSFVDLLDAAASRKYMTSVPFDSQLKRAALDGRVVAKLMREFSTAPKTGNPKYSRMCLLVNIYHNSKLLTVIDMTSAENRGPTGTPITSDLSTISQRGISKSLISNLVPRRVSSVNVNFIVHLDQQARPEIITDALAHYTQAINDLSAGQGHSGAPPLTTNSRIVPSYARSTLSSRGSPGSASVKAHSSLKRRLPSPSTPQMRKRVSPNYGQDQIRSKIDNSVQIRDSVEIKNLKASVDALQSKLQDEKSSKCKAIENLQSHLRAIKSHTLANLQTELSNAKTSLDDASKHIKLQAESAEVSQRKLAHALHEKSSIEEKFSEVTESLALKGKEMEQFKETVADEKRELALAFESELRSMTQKSCSLEEEIASLVALKNSLETSNSTSTKEKDDLIHQTQLLKEQIESTLTELESWKRASAEAEEKVDLKETQLQKLRAEIAANCKQVTKLEEQLEKMQSSLNEKTNSWHEQVKITQSKENLIESLQTDLKSQKEEFQMLLQKGKETNSDLDTRKTEVEEMKSSIKLVEETCAALQVTNRSQEDELVSLKRELEQKQIVESEALALQKKYTQLETELKEVSEKARTEQLDHEKHIIRLNEELGKAKMHMSPPKKLSSFAEMEFNHGNNTLSSIDIFDDQTEYANFFRQPTTGRSPVASPTRVLTESNVRTTTETQVKIAPRNIDSHLEGTHHLGQVTDENRP